MKPAACPVNAFVTSPEPSRRAPEGFGWSELPPAGLEGTGRLTAAPNLTPDSGRPVRPFQPSPAGLAPPPAIAFILKADVAEGGMWPSGKPWCLSRGRLARPRCRTSPRGPRTQPPAIARPRRRPGRAPVLTAPRSTLEPSNPEVPRPRLLAQDHPARPGLPDDPRSPGSSHEQGPATLDRRRGPVHPLEHRRFLALRPRRLAITETAHLAARPSKVRREHSNLRPAR